MERERWPATHGLAGACGLRALAGFDEDDALAALRAFARSARALVEGAAPLRPARARFAAAARVGARGARGEIRRAAEARALLRERISTLSHPIAAAAAGFSPAITSRACAARSTRTRDFTAPILARPGRSRHLAARRGAAGFDPAVTGARRLARRDAAALSRPRRDRGARRRNPLALARRPGRGLPRPGAGLGARRTARRAAGAARLRRAQRPALYVDRAPADRGRRDRRARDVARPAEVLAARARPRARRARARA